jgi:Zn-dependent protease
MAERLGDSTARYAGRLTVNPLAHIDWWGSILLPLLLFFGTQGRFMFAYAKPVPYNPYNLKNQRWGPALVGLAGPLANLLLALSFALVLRVVPGLVISPFLGIIVYANILLMVFNLVPIPPLDGSKILFTLLPDSLHHFKITLERYGFFILLFFVFFLFEIISPVIDFLFTLLVGQRAIL